MLKKTLSYFSIIAFVALLICILITTCHVFLIPETIVWATPFSIDEKTQTLVNEILNTKGYNFQIEFLYIKDYEDNIEQLLSSSDIDIVCSPFYRWDLIGARKAINDLMLPLNGFLETDLGQRLYESYPATFWDCMQDNGAYYWIFQGGNVPATPAAIVNKNIVEECSLDVDSITYENICTYAVEVYFSYSESGTYAISNPAQLLTSIPKHTFVCSPLIPLVISDEDESLTIVNMLETDVYNRVYESMQYLSTLDAISYDTTTSEAYFSIISYTTYEDYMQTAHSDNICIQLMSDNTLYPVEILGQGVGISKNSDRIEEAFSILAEIYTDEALSNLLVYGEREVDYQVIDGHAASFSEPFYVNPSIGFGNMFLTFPHFYQDTYKNQTYLAQIENTPLSYITGFVFDGNAVKEEIKAVTEIMYNYYLKLANDPESLKQPLSDVIDQLNEAGLQAIQLEVSNQLETWLSSQ